MTDGTGSGSPPGQAQPPAPTGSTPPAPARKTHKDKATISALCHLSLWLHLKANQTIEAANRARELATFNYLSDPTVYLQPGSALASYVTISDSKISTLQISSMAESHREVMPSYLVQQFALKAESARADKRKLETQESDPDAKRCCMSGSKLIVYNPLKENDLLFPDSLFLTELYSPLPLPLFVQSVLEKIVVNAHRIPLKKHTVVETKSTVYIWNIEAISHEFSIKKEKELEFGLYLEATDAFFKFQCKRASDNVIIMCWSKHFKYYKKKSNSSENYHGWKGSKFEIRQKLLVYLFDFDQTMYNTSYNNAMQDYKNEICIQEAIAQALALQVSNRNTPARALGVPRPFPSKNQQVGGSFRSSPTCLICSESGHTIQGHSRDKTKFPNGEPTWAQYEGNRFVSPKGREICIPFNLRPNVSTDKCHHETPRIHACSFCGLKSHHVLSLTCQGGKAT